LDEEFPAQHQHSRAIIFVAKPMPVIDYHSHQLPDQTIISKSPNAQATWLAGDHYLKWRTMRRTNGINELCLQIDASDEKIYAVGGWFITS